VDTDIVGLDIREWARYLLANNMDEPKREFDLVEHPVTVVDFGNVPLGECPGFEPGILRVKFCDQ
jgi:hypothetical protein